MTVRVQALRGGVRRALEVAELRGRGVRWRGGGSPGGGRAPPEVWLCRRRRGASYRDVAVLAPRAVDLLGAGLLEAVDDDPASFGGGDHIVDHRPTRGPGRGGLRADRVEQLSARFLGVAGRLDLF